jgi:beta-ureidopropionase / N-carbamoyl-L-amino-acid hydrolase
VPEVLRTAQEFAGECDVVVREIMSTGPVEFDMKLIEVLERAANVLNLPVMRLFSGAFHDASLMSRLCPSAMIFVPCAGGISHSPLESATPGNLAAGARVLAVALAVLSSE